MVVYSNGQHLLGQVLADHMLVKVFINLKQKSKLLTGFNTREHALFDVSYTLERVRLVTRPFTIASNMP